MPPSTSVAHPDAAFWRGKRVLLTGHTGFKGAWLALWLEHLGAEAVCAVLEDINPIDATRDHAAYDLEQLFLAVAL